MATWLLKSEPETYSFADLVRDGRTVWSGVTANAALLHMRAAKKGDEAFIYHTGGERAIAGIAKIVSDPYPDPKNEALNARGVAAFPVFDLKPVKAVPRPVTLDQIKADARFKDFALVRIGRLSVMPVPAAMDRALRSMAGL